MKSKKTLIASAITALVLLACTLTQPIESISANATPAQLQLFAFLNTPTATPAPPTSTPSPVPTPLLSGMVMRDVIYCRPDGQPQTMDIFFPNTGYGPWPVIMNVHGGAWVAGSKLLIEEDTDIQPFLDAGYIIVSVNYRLAPRFPFPDMIEDLKCAVRYLRANAADYNLDADHIGVRGGSAGGHLAALLGASDPSAGWDVGEYTEYSSRVQAVVAMSGPYNLTDPSFYKPMHEVAQDLLRDQDPDLEKLRTASVTTYITPDDPPFLILYGDLDRIINPVQASLLYNALNAAGVPAQLVLVKNGNHKLLPGFNATTTTPSYDELTVLMVSFFDQYLKPVQ